MHLAFFVAIVYHSKVITYIVTGLSVQSMFALKKETQTVD